MQNIDAHIEKSSHYFKEVDYLYEESTWQNFKVNKSYCLLVVEQENNIIGFALLSVKITNDAPHLQEKKIAFISDFA
ncbi:hypothetical protein [Virgibacillus sp. DJP39]|uniref:hypothetical protein n=1 Tax=Virgibacillus sp. DJP39 TaxID=3409790 RepID=UPI003BB79E1C